MDRTYTFTTEEQQFIYHLLLDDFRDNLREVRESVANKHIDDAKYAAALCRTGDIILKKFEEN